MGKTKAVVVGGKRFNVSKEFHRHFDVVAHVEQDARTPKLSRDIEIILVIRDFVRHGAVQEAQAQLPGVPIVAARVGWSHMAQELVKRGLLPEVVQEQEQEEIGEEAMDPQPTPDDEVLEIIARMKGQDELIAMLELEVERQRREIEVAQKNLDETSSSLDAARAAAEMYRPFREKFVALREEILKLKAPKPGA